MASDPFAPPKAQLERRVEPAPAPHRVQQAVKLIWASIGLQIVTLVALWAGLITLIGVTGPAAMATTTASQLAGGALWLFLSLKILKGRNWARWTYAVFVGLGTVSIVLVVVLASQMWGVFSTFQIVSPFVHTALQLLALVLMFSREANQWFSEMRASP